MSEEMEPGRQEEALDPVSKKEPWPFYPLLASVFPVLAIGSANLGMFPAPTLLRPSLAALAAGVLLLFVASGLWRSWHRGAGSAFVAVLILWFYEPLIRLIERPMQSLLFSHWVVGLGGFALAALAGRLSLPVRPLNLLSGLIVLSSLVSLAWGSLFGSPKGAPEVMEAHRGGLKLPPGPRPDIYFLVFDGFGRADKMERTLGADLDWHVKELEKRGFQVASRARPNYVQTELSLSATLNMGPLQELLTPEELKTQDRGLLDPLTENPTVVELLENAGYRALALGTGFSRPWLGKRMLPLAESSSFSLLEGALLNRTPAAFFEGPLQGMFVTHYNRITGVFRRLEELAPRASQPRFIMAHILSPHPPFVVGPDGERLKPKPPFGLFDASDYMAFVGSKEAYRKGFGGQAQFVAKRSLALVDHLLKSNPQNPPIIILQGDHGSKSGLDQNSLGKTDLQEAFSILYAVKAPSSLKLDIPQDTTSYNTFRLILSALGVEGLDPLPDQSWYSPYASPFSFEEVTDRLPR